MPVDGPVPWERPDHTAAKHDIYRRYLERWFPILLGGSKAYKSATYAEGFAGPGVYVGGYPGSPIIAIEALLKQVPNPEPVVKMIFVDDDPRCTKMLREQLNSKFPTRPRSREKLPISIELGTCVDKLEPQLDAMDAWEQPILAVLDSWGNVPVTYRLLQRLARNQSSEVIITLGTQHFIRFVSKMGPGADEVFGGDPNWRRIDTMATGQAKRQHILTCYRQTLSKAGFKYLLDFELVDRRGESLYLVFGTNHRRGLEKMKDSAWEVDRVYGVGFRDPRDEQAETLFELTDPALAPLGRLLLARLKNEPKASVRVETLRDFALFDTVYRPEHVIRTLKGLRDNGLVESDRSGLYRSSFVRLAR
ncbi:three-Cys-motif partner protein TcmP [Amycolatopsis acidicola]|uniref:Three-Cys-motif partner protein TcmP n=1 Tax=Amycolatopsis acidicola TaxID=2596893 RepID=A0A5N0VCZ0_9PSEU|nr:three-Cys-motif partner protein TcmP [Amycolatopsis acidicola]KAA9163223.1 three-Cys-motif partner protein TcmP [Amycolatopsis acidicola]